MRKVILFSALCFAAGVLHAQTPIVAGSTLTIRDCVNIAVQNDPDIQSYEYTSQAQEDVVKQSKSAYYPNLSASAGYLSNHSIHKNNSDIYASNIGTYDGKTAGLTLNQLLFDFGKTQATVSASKAGATSAKYDKDTQTAEVAAMVKQAYYAFSFAQLALSLSDEILTQYQRNLTYAIAHYEAKLRPKYDVTKAEADLSSSQLDHIKAANNVFLARAYLTNTMNLINAPDFNVEQSTSFVKYEVNFDSLVAEAYARNPTLLSMMSNADSLEAQLKIASRDRYPALNATAGYNYIGSHSPISQGWNAGLNISADLFTGMRKSSRVAEQENRLKALRSKIDSLKLQIHLDAKQAYLNLMQYDQAIQTSITQVQQATENLDIANLRYQTGLGSPMEITDATVMYNNAKMALLNSLYQYKIAQINIEKIKGSKQ